VPVDLLPDRTRVADAPAQPTAAAPARLAAPGYVTASTTPGTESAVLVAATLWLLVALSLLRHLRSDTAAAPRRVRRSVVRTA
jgi:hypothetical protein